MNRRIIRWGLCGLLLTSVAFGASVSNKKSFGGKKAPSVLPQSVQWMTDLEKAHHQSLATGKPMLIVFGGPGCQYCKKLDREVLHHATIQKYIQQNFIPVHLDTSKNLREAEILEVTSLPTTYILSPEADLLGSVEGFVSVKQFATVLKQSADLNRAEKTDPAVARGGR
jgi:thioredoxin-related protein